MFINYLLNIQLYDLIVMWQWSQMQANLLFVLLVPFLTFSARVHTHAHTLFLSMYLKAFITFIAPSMPTNHSHANSYFKLFSLIFYVAILCVMSVNSWFYFLPFFKMWDICFDIFCLMISGYIDLLLCSC